MTATTASNGRNGGLSGCCPGLRFPAALRWVLAFIAIAGLSRARAADPTEAGLLTRIQAEVTVERDGARLVVASNLVLRAYDRIITSERGGAWVKWSDRTVLRLRENTVIRVLPPAGSEAPALLRLLQGAFLFFSRERRAELEFDTPYEIGAVKGTEFELRHAADATVLSLWDGEVELHGNGATVTLRSGDQARVGADRRRDIRPLVARDEVQWWLYYPAVLDVDELPAPPAGGVSSAESRARWRAGDFRGALALAPWEDAPTDPGERVYAAALALVSGDTARVGRLIGDDPSSPARGLRAVLAAVAGHAAIPANPPESATEWLGRSYLLQSLHRINEARDAATAASRLAPDCGLAWYRRAELDFATGDRHAMDEALRRALVSSPELPAAHALRGFANAATGRLPAAAESFAAALDRDPALADAWLGRGLLAFRRGDRAAGLAALQTAVAAQRDRAFLRAYLGEGWARDHDHARAEAEFTVARELDPGDPTAWYFAALEKYGRNEVNAAVEDLESALDRNDRRAIYRSRRLLDQDRALRETSLARVYQRAGLPEAAWREAALAVAADYSSPSAHLFLSDTYNALRDPTRFDLRYETPWFQEFLLANLLLPVEAGALSPSLSSQEYARLFAPDGLSATGETTVRSDGRFRQLATQGGTFGRLAYQLDLDYSHEDGAYPNQDLERMELYTQLKAQLTPDDAVVLIAKIQEYDSGDNFQHRNPADVDPDFRFREHQYPLLAIMGRHEWAPGQQTLALAGWLDNRQEFTDREACFHSILANTPFPAERRIADLDYSGRLALGIGELSHLAQSEQHSIQAGVRVAAGTLDTRAQLQALDPLADGGPELGSAEQTADILRTGAYAYDTWRPFRRAAFTAGLAWDRLDWPRNFRAPPLTPGEDSVSELLPKAGVVWGLTDHVSVRAMAARSLGGVTLDESFRLEPAQVAGFPQAYRTVIPESVVGSVSGHLLDLAGVALEGRWETGWYGALRAQGAWSQVRQDEGRFVWDTVLPETTVQPLAVDLDFAETDLTADLHRRLGDYWTLGAGYGFREDTLDSAGSLGSYREDGTLTARLHSANVEATFNHPAGAFGRTTFRQLWQSASTGAAAHVPWDLELGWRCRRRHGELAVGVLNLLDDDHRLDPLSRLPDLPRERVYYARLRFAF